MSKAMPIEPPEGEKIAVFTPMTPPSMLNVGPPELPGFTAALIVPSGDSNPRLQAKDKVDEVALCDDIEPALTPSTT
jgi:hypothetical protein